MSNSVEIARFANKERQNLPEVIFILLFLKLKFPSFSGAWILENANFSKNISHL